MQFKCLGDGRTHVVFFVEQVAIIGVHLIIIGTASPKQE